MINEQTRVIDVTIGELMSYINENIKVAPQEQKETEIEDAFIHGIKAFADRYHISEKKAHQIRHSGVLGDGNVIKTVRSVKFRKKECDELYNKGVF